MNGPEESLQLSHARISPGLVCEFGTRQESYRLGKVARPTINLQRYITPVPRSSFADGIATPASTNTTVLTHGPVPEGKIWLVTHAFVSVSLTVGGPVRAVISRQPQSGVTSGRIAGARRDVSALHDLDVNVTCRVWLSEGDLIRATVVTGALAVGLADAGFDAYEFCGGVWPGV